MYSDNYNGFVQQPILHVADSYDTSHNRVQLGVHIEPNEASAAIKSPSFNAYQEQHASGQFQGDPYARNALQIVQGPQTSHPVPVSPATYERIQRHILQETTQSVQLPPSHQANNVTPASNIWFSGQSVQHGARRGEYRSYLDGAVNADVALPKCTIGAMELCTFFPNHTQWPNALLRLKRNGWVIKNIAKAQLFARANLTTATLVKRNAALRHQIVKARAEYHAARGNDAEPLDMTVAVNDGDATAWQPGETVAKRIARKAIPSLLDVSLLDCASGVINWPQGEDVGIVSQCITLAVMYQMPDWRVSDIPWLAQQYNCLFTPEASNCVQWDRNALVRLQQTLLDNGITL